ncbi:unnamed protein product, partial [Ectocarpus sp. 8 AP-2014]
CKHRRPARRCEQLTGVGGGGYAESSSRADGPGVCVAQGILEGAGNGEGDRNPCRRHGSSTASTAI